MYNDPPTSPWPRNEIPGPPPPPATIVPRSNPLLIGLVASVTANVILLLCLLGVFLLARSGAFAPTNSTLQGGSVLENGVTPTAGHGSPIATLSPTTTANWLQVAPSSVQLTCKKNQQQQTVVLSNSGPQDVQWQVDFGVPADQAPVDVSPRQGTQHSGSSTPIQIQVRGGFGSQQGTLRFVPVSPMAGSPPSLSYSITGCQGG